MLVNAASVLARPMPRFAGSADAHAIYLMTRRIRVMMDSGLAHDAKFIDYPECMPDEMIRLIMTDLHRGAYDSMDQNGLAARMMWQQAVCTGIAWQIGRGDYVRSIIDPAIGPCVVECNNERITKDMYGRIRHVQHGYSEILAGRVYCRASLMSLLEQHIGEVMREMRIAALIRELDALAER